MTVFKKPMWRITADDKLRTYGHMLNTVTVYPEVDSGEEDAYEVTIVIPTQLFKWLKDVMGVEPDSETVMYLECNDDGNGYTFGVEFDIGEGVEFADLWSYRNPPPWSIDK